jgi:CHAT domain-containing protein/Tfp pilus assembly protein PilF
MRPHTVLATLPLLGTLLIPVAGSTETNSPADEKLARARELYTQDGPTAALPVYVEALELYREAGNRLGEAITVGLIGNCHKRLGDYERALELLEQALIMKRELGNRLEEGKTLSHLGLVHWEQADYDRAIEHLEEAAAIGKEIDDAKLQGAALNNLSLVFDELGDYERSLEQYRLALDLFRDTGFAEGESYVLGNIGGVHLLLGQFREAMGYYEQALAISERLESKPSMSQDLGNLAICHLGLGEASQALARLDRALALAREAGLAKEEADWLKGKGDVLLDTGQHSEGLALYEQALSTYESAGLQRELAESLNELAALHLQLGDLAAAEEYLQRSLSVARSINFTRGVLTDLTALGELERRRERYEKAADFLRQALAGADEAGESTVAASCHIQLAVNYRDQGEFDRALAEARLGLEATRGLDSKLLQAEALYTLGDIELEQGKAPAALARFDEAPGLLAGLGEPDIAWRLAHRRGRALEALTRREQAVEAYKEAVRLIETVRGRLHDERFRAGYIDDKHEAYIDLARLLVLLDRQEEAFSYAEKLRARTYLDLLSRDRMPRLTDEQRRRETELRQRVRRLQRSLEEELDPTYEPRRQAMERFVVELDEAESDYEEFLSGLRDVDPDLAATWTLAVPDAGTTRSSLPPDSALLEFIVGNRATIVFALTRDGLRAHLAPLARKDLRTKVELLRELIRRRDSDDWRYPAASLSATLIEPVLSDHRLAPVRHLILVPHDVLHYLPFAVLPRGDRDRALIEDYRLSYLPAAGTLVLAARGESMADGLLALAPGSTRLRHSATEARAVAAALAGTSRVLVGKEATERSFKTLAPDFGTLHLATHNTWNRPNPLLSALELEPGSGEDGRLEVHEILDLELVADLVTLSACETALGTSYRGTTPIGDDFVGLTRAFLHAGSGAVVASLWEVDDESTLDLMKRFYFRLNESERPAAALAEAQRAMLVDGGRMDPYRWAAFIVVGGTVSRGES